MAEELNMQESKQTQPVSFLAKYWNRFWSFISLFPEFDHASMVADPAGVLRAWRERALKILVFFTLLLKLPIVIKLIGSGSEVLPGWAILFFLILYIPSILIVLIESVPISRRTYLLMGLKLISGTTQLVSTQLLGSGRLTLMMVPAMALVLAGPAVAIHFVIICSVVIGTTMYLVANGIIEPATVYNGVVPTEYLILQGKMWLVEVFPHLYLMGHFLFLHERTLVAVSDARKQLDEESEKNRKLELEMHRIAEQERQRLGAELHDGLCQHLTATLLKCSSLMYVLKEEEKPELAAVERISGAVEKSIALAYQISRGLVPVRIEPDALVPALQELCLAKWTESNIECNFVAETEAQIDNPEVALQLYRIASEAITNAVKHSGCSAIRVKISSSERELLLEITDNGGGIECESNNSGGMGLSIMEYRASLIGGFLETINNHSEGFTVLCHIPLEKI